ncbi:MAG: hypothetical protein H6559_00115 [Lewinellaceae bacterium]|nr:hypothetical protein [Lewinellaceae bacterium]
MDFNSNTLMENEARIIKYLHGNLEKEKLIEFEERLKQDPALRFQTQRIKNLIMVLDDPELIKAEGILLEMRDKNIAAIENKMGPLEKQWRQLASGAKAALSLASLLIIVLLLFFVAINIIGTNASDFYWSDKKPYPVTFPKEALDDQLLQDAITAYEQKDWGRAEALFKALSERGPTYKFYYIVAHLWENQDDDAENLALLKQFRESLKFEDGPYSKQLDYWAQYYTALIYFKQGQIEEGKRIIYQLHNEGDIYGSLKDAVGVIQEKVDNSWFLF